MAFLAGIVTTIIRVVVGVGLMAGFLWLAIRLVSRMTGLESKSPPGHEPADRTDDEDPQVY